MLGLEALYARGTDGIGRQLTERTELLLGPRVEHKRAVSNLYAYRSRFLHGDEDLPLGFNVDSFERIDRPLEVKNYEHWGYACAILLASIQELVQRNQHTLEFDTVLRS